MLSNSAKNARKSGLLLANQSKILCDTFSSLVLMRWKFFLFFLRFYSFFSFLVKLVHDRRSIRQLFSIYSRLIKIVLSTKKKKRRLTIVAETNLRNDKKKKWETSFRNKVSFCCEVCLEDECEFFEIESLMRVVSNIWTIFEHYILLLLLHLILLTLVFSFACFFFSSNLLCLCVGVSYNVWQFVFLLYSNVFGLLR